MINCGNFKLPHISKTSFALFSKTNPSFRSHWNKTDLPLQPRVTFAHQHIKRALEKYKNDIPNDFADLLKKHLENVRSINWQYLNGTGVNQRETDKVKSILNDLINIEHELPVLLKDELKEVAAFESLKTAINCLEERVYPTNSKPTF